MKKSFATLSSKIEELENNSDLTGSDSNHDEDEDAESHFQYTVADPPTGFQMLQLELHDVAGVPDEEGTLLHQEFEQRNADVLCKKNHGQRIKLDLKNVILLDSQSTLDLVCNRKLVDKVTTASNEATEQWRHHGGQTESHDGRLRSGGLV
jgi:hypothetical protein